MTNEQEYNLENKSLNESVDSKFLVAKSRAESSDQLNNESIQNPKKEEYLSAFLDQMDQELKKIFLAYISKERELYLLVNSHLHIRTNYK